MNASEIIERLNAIRQRRLPVGYDLEGSTFVSCQAFAESPTRAVCIVTDQLGEDSARIWSLVAAILEDPTVPKWVWNAHHELAVLKLAHGITLHGWEDGMARWFEVFPELPKGLKYAASILTRRPCWTEGIEFDEGDDGNVTAQRGEAFWRYNMNDAAATIELAQHKQLTHLTPATEDRYALRKTLIEALTWASLKGVRYDTALADRLRAELEPRMWAAQAEVNRLAGVTLPANADELLTMAAKAWCHSVKLRKFTLPGSIPSRIEVTPEKGANQKTGVVNGSVPVDSTSSAQGESGLTDPNAGVVAGVGASPNPVGQKDPCVTAGETARPRKRKPKPPPPPLEPLTWKAALDIAKKDGAAALHRIRATWMDQATNPGASGELADLLGIGVNVKSSGKSSQVIAVLDRLGLPKVYRRGERGDEGARTKDADVLLDLYLRTSHPVTVALLKTISLRTQLQELDRKIDADGRIRCSFTSCGTETDRTTSHKWLTGAGGNLQTVPKAPVNFRRCYVPDPALEWWKFDFTGADAWTVAARCASLGDPTMLDDLRAGLRIPTLLALTLEGVRIHEYDRPALATMCRDFKRDWRDLAFKRATYGTMYGMTPKGVRRVAVADSFRELGEPLDPGLQLCARIQAALHNRYWGIAKWWQWVAAQLKQTGRLTAASGLTREFYGRRIVAGQIDETTLKQAYAYEPQVNTTYCLNRAVAVLWTDPENRDAAGEPIIQVLLVVHDEATGQAPAARRDWVRAKVSAAMAQRLTIGKVEVDIPAVLRFGTSWGECKEP